MLTEQTSAGVEVARRIKLLGQVGNDASLHQVFGQDRHDFCPSEHQDRLTLIRHHLKLVTLAPISGHLAVNSGVVTHAHESKLAAGAALNGGGLCARGEGVHNAYLCDRYVGLHRASRLMLRTMHQSIRSDKR